MARTAEAIIKPALLIWARQSAGMSVEEAGERSGFGAPRLAEWESGEARPSVAQLRSLAELYKRPFAAFFMPAPPAMPAALKKFRRQPDMLDVNDMSSALTMRLRASEERRAALIDLIGALDESWPRFSWSAKVGDNAAALAAKIRDDLKVPISDQFSWANENEAYRRWRARLEHDGILVFQASGVEPSEARGYSVFHEVAPIIAVNTKDSPRARCFTLMHEFAHLLLHRSNICDASLEHGRLSDPKEEEFCNEFAGSLLVPKESLLSEIDQSEFGEPTYGVSSGELKRLSNRYKVSRECVARRLTTIGKIQEKHYKAWRALIAKQFAEPKPKKKVIVPIETKTLANLGRPFVRTVMQAHYADRITLSDVAGYLGVKVDYLKKIERKLHAPSTSIGDEAVV